MITSKQILQATRLKSQKTLTRWAQAGFIPEPYIGTHPAGRGKIAYWPDWVLERCKRIVELRHEGHTLGSAVAAIEHERMLNLMEKATKAPDFSKMLSQKQISLSDDKKVSLDSFLIAVIAKEVEHILSSAELRSKFATEMSNCQIVAMSLKLVSARYNPVALFDSERVEVVADFLVSHRLSEEKPGARAWIVIPLLPSLQKAFVALGRQLPEQPKVTPAPKVWAKEDGAIVEYSIFFGGGLGFELIRDTAKTIGMVPENLDENESP